MIILCIKKVTQRLLKKVPRNGTGPPILCHFENSEILQMTYYCGSAPICKNTGNYDVLQRAKYNVEAYYTLVGMANDLKRSFELLEVLLPAFFKGTVVFS